jgi:hypothetical protein
LHLPEANNRYYLMPILDGWTEVIGNPGTRTTGEEAGDYAITGPQWTGTLPAGVKEIKSGTNMIWIAGRTYTSGTAQDYDAVHEMQDQYTLVPLALFGNADPTHDQKTEGAVDPNIDMTTFASDSRTTVDGEMKKLDGEVTRRTVAEVMAELDRGGRGGLPTPLRAKRAGWCARSARSS